MKEKSEKELKAKKVKESKKDKSIKTEKQDKKMKKDKKEKGISKVTQTIKRKWLIDGTKTTILVLLILAIFFGKFLSKHISEESMKKLSGILFIIFGIIGFIFN